MDPGEHLLILGPCLEAVAKETSISLELLDRISPFPQRQPVGVVINPRRRFEVHFGTLAGTQRFSNLEIWTEDSTSFFGGKTTFGHVFELDMIASRAFYGRFSLSHRVRTVSQSHHAAPTRMQLGPSRVLARRVLLPHHRTGVPTRHACRCLVSSVPLPLPACGLRRPRASP